MSYKVNNLDFFKTKITEDEKEEAEKEEMKTEEMGNEETKTKKVETSQIKENAAKMKNQKPTNAKPVKINPELVSILKTAKQMFLEAGLQVLVQEINRVEQNLAKNFFSIAVVGEFSKGKSSFLNALLEKEILPVGNLPTTAIMTRIRYNPEEVLVVFDENGKKKESLPLSEDSWEGLVAENFNEDNSDKHDPKGTVLAGIDFAWLKENHIELIDTPGAGDLEESRAQVIGDALIGCDGAIITVSASAVLSMSERLFIEERLITRKTPFLMLIITKLDNVPKKQRADIIRYTKEKLSVWNAEIPVYIPYPVETEEDAYQDIIGMDKIKTQIEKWTIEPERARLTTEWLAARLLSILDTGVSVFSEQKLMLDSTDEKERERLIAEKKAQISKAQIVWEDLRIQMMERGNQCYELLLEKADEYSGLITERLQYELSHTNNPEKWWKEDYPYRAKVELANMMVGINNTLMKKIGEDTQWFNFCIDKNFKTHVLCKKETIADKAVFKEISMKDTISFEDIQKEKAAVRVGTAAATIAGVLLMASSGIGLPILATTGIGTGVSLVSEKVFREKIEKQKEMLKGEIERSIPVFIQNAMQESEKRLKAVYENVADEAQKSEDAWLEAQKAAIEKTAVIKDTEEKKKVYQSISQLEQMREKLQHI